MKYAKIISFCILLNLSQLQAMDLSPETCDILCDYVTKKNPEMIAKIMEATQKNVQSITCFQSSSFPLFSPLPSEVGGILMDITIPTTSLNDAVKVINTFPLICKSMNTFMNEKQNVLRLIKSLSFVFDCSNEEVTNVLQIKAAGKRLKIQKEFQAICGTDSNATISPKQSLYLKNNNTDIDFTYSCARQTQLEVAAGSEGFLIVKGREPKPHIVQWLLENNACILNSDGLPVFFKTPCTDLGNETVTHFLKSSAFDLNKLYQNKKTEVSTSYGAFFFLNLVALMKDLDNYSPAIKRLQLLLEYGADPESPMPIEIPGFKAITLLQILQTAKAEIKSSDTDALKKYEEIIKILQDAIAKKHAQQSCKN